MTVTNRILLQVALGAALVIAIATAVTYGIVYDTARRHALDHLDTYVAERTEREEAFFRQIQSNLELVREQFLRRNPYPPPRDYQAQWDRWFERFPDGAWRSRKEFSDGRKWSSLWMNKDVQLTPDIMTQILRANNITNDFLAGWVDSFPSLYFVFTYDANIGFDPRIPNWVWETPADYSNNTIEAVAACNPQNNPGRQIVWNSLIPEPTSRLPYISVMLPIDVDGKHIASLGHDLHALRLLDDSTHSGLRAAEHFIFRDDGRLIVHRQKMNEIISHEGRLTMQDSGDPALRSLYAAVTGHRERRFTGYDAVSGCYYAISRLAGPEWLFITTMPKSAVQQHAFQSAQWVLWSGLFSLSVLLAFFATILRRQVDRPLAIFLEATRRLAEGEIGVRMEATREDEFGRLAHAFNEMEEKIEARSAELRDSEQRWRALFEQSPLSVQIFAPDGTTRLVNRGYEEFWKISLPALANYNVLHDPQLEQNGVAPLLRRAFAGEVVAVPEAPYDPSRNAGIDGAAAEMRWLSALLYPLLDAEGHVREVICIHEDITERKKAEDEIRALNQSLEKRVAERTGELECTNRELQQEVEQRKRAEADLAAAVAKEREINELKSNFVSMVSHEFRTPLGVIMSAADVLDRYLDRLAPEERREHLDMIFRSTRNLAQLVESVLLLGKVEDGRLQFNPRPLDLSGVCHELVDEMCSATTQRCPIELTTGSDLQGAQSDPDLLRHIFTNLLGNAAKYSDPGTPISFHVERRNGAAVFTVRDRGIGISAEDQANLFKSFARGRNVGQRPGSGLGLLIVKRCAERHGGSVEIASQIGEGTTVTVTLPVFSHSPS